MAFGADQMMNNSRTRALLRWGVLLASFAFGAICFYFVFMYGSLSVAPSPVQDHYRFLANMNLYLGLGGLLAGVIVFYRMRSDRRNGKGSE